MATDTETSIADVAARAEALRARYRPDPIKILFVGESAPAGGTFFYSANSQVYRYLREALAPFLGEDGFLDRFRDNGFFLDDLALTPVNQLGASERSARNWEAVPSLAERLAAYQPRAVVGIAKAISAPVRAAHAQARLDCPLYVVAFPGTGQQANFRRELEAILPDLILRASS